MKLNFFKVMWEGLRLSLRLPKFKLFEPVKVAAVLGAYFVIKRRFVKGKGWKYDLQDFTSHEKLTGVAEDLIRKEKKK